jgi:hypothetical protein
MKLNHKRSSLFRHGYLRHDVILLNAIKTVARQHTISVCVPSSGVKNRDDVQAIVELAGGNYQGLMESLKLELHT